jgi:hypothetical protein
MQAELRSGIGSGRVRVFASRLSPIATKQQARRADDVGRASQTGKTVRPTTRSGRRFRVAAAEDYFFFRHLPQDLRLLGATGICEVEFGVSKTKKAKVQRARPG